MNLRENDALLIFIGCVQPVLSVFLWYCSVRWCVTVKGEEITICRPFHKTHTYHITELGGYTKCDSGRKIVDRYGKTVCIVVTLFVGVDLLYNYFLKKNMII